MKKLLLGIILACALYWGYNKANCNFSIANITLSDWIAVKDVPTNSPADLELAKTVFDQPFHYLGRGRQSFIFESSDNHYILKFNKCQRINVSPLFKTLPLPHFLDVKRQKVLDERSSRIRHHLESMKLARDPLADLCGVIYLHIQPGNDTGKTLTLIDRLGFSHKVDIDSVPYILQKKAMRVMPVLKKLVKAKKTDELKQRLNQLIDLFVERASLGIINPDSSILKHDNIGYTDTRAIYIDLGTFRRSKKSASSSALLKDLKRLLPIASWLKRYDKEVAVEFTNNINRAAANYSQEMT
ncbi:MAG: hypothetical protein LLF94_10770 [Chlamydiales bacterium]|nr:hypothetical protein [Chlamydiales bacterium]